MSEPLKFESHADALEFARRSVEESQRWLAEHPTRPYIKLPTVVGEEVIIPKKFIIHAEVEAMDWPLDLTT